MEKFLCRKGENLISTKKICINAMGVLLYCVLTSGLKGMPGWMFGNIVLIIGFGICITREKVFKNIAEV